MSTCTSLRVNLWRQTLTGDVVEVVAVQLVLIRGDPHCQHVLVFGRQKLCQLGVISSLRNPWTRRWEGWKQTVCVYVYSVIFTCTHPTSIAWSTCARFFMIRTSLEVESAHWPFWMGLMKRLRNSPREPSRFLLMKLTMQWSVGAQTNVSTWRVWNFNISRFLFNSWGRISMENKWFTWVPNFQIYSNALKDEWKMTDLKRIKVCIRLWSFWI